MMMVSLNPGGGHQLWSIE